MIVKKAYNMAEMMHIPVLGLVENYSYIACPDCGKKIEIFGESHVDEVAASLNIPVLGKMPMDRAFATAADAGRIFDVENSYLDGAKSVLENIKEI
jgi:Mrp family chromosome partitioning ATPase